jgi:hypothetical protein
VGLCEFVSHSRRPIVVVHVSGGADASNNLLYLRLLVDKAGALLKQ